MRIIIADEFEQHNKDKNMTKKTTKKITILIVVVIAIVGAIIHFSSNVNETGNKQVATTDFEKYIAKEVNEKVKNRYYEDAKEGWQSIRNEIQTEYGILLANGEPNLSRQEAAACYKMNNDAYVPIFINEAKSYFNIRRSSWDGSQLNAFKKEAAQLQTISDNKDLANIISWVNGYYDLSRAIRSANYCRSVAMIENLENKANQYNGWPYTNNNELNAGRRSMVATAKTACKRNIVAYCRSIVNKYYSSYAEWKQKYNHASDMIYRYKDKYGGEFDDVENELAERDYEMSQV